MIHVAILNPLLFRCHSVHHHCRTSILRILQCKQTDWDSPMPLTVFGEQQTQQPIRTENPAVSVRDGVIYAYLGNPNPD